MRLDLCLVSLKELATWQFIRPPPHRALVTLSLVIGGVRRQGRASNPPCRQRANFLTTPAGAERAPGPGRAVGVGGAPASPHWVPGPATALDFTLPCGKGLKRCHGRSSRASRSWFWGSNPSRSWCGWSFGADPQGCCSDGWPSLHELKCRLSTLPLESWAPDGQRQLGQLRLSHCPKVGCAGLVDSLRSLRVYLSVPQLGPGLFGGSRARSHFACPSQLRSWPGVRGQRVG